MKNLSVVIITFNEEDNIRDCLESVKWADEIVVVDSFSTDKTSEISKSYTNNFVQREWKGYADQKAFALSLAKNEWVLSLDADERVSEKLKEIIISILESNETADGYKIPRQNYFLGKWIKGCGWYPDNQLRLFRKNKTSMSNRLVHESFIVDGKIEYLKNDIIHFTHSSIKTLVKKINDYSSLEAEERSPRKKVYWFNIIINPTIALFQHFIIRRGFRDGFYGFLVSIFHALTKLLTYIKIWEKQRRKN